MKKETDEKRNVHRGKDENLCWQEKKRCEKGKESW